MPEVEMGAFGSVGGGGGGGGFDFNPEAIVDTKVGDYADDGPPPLQEEEDDSPALTSLVRQFISDEGDSLLLPTDTTPFGAQPATRDRWGSY